MSTRANIKFSDKWDNYYIDRSHDGFPDNILPDIKETIDHCKGKWSGSELGQLVSYFLKEGDIFVCKNEECEGFDEKYYTKGNSDELYEGYPC